MPTVTIHYLRCEICKTIMQVVASPEYWESKDWVNDPCPNCGGVNWRHKAHEVEDDVEVKET